MVFYDRCRWAGLPKPVEEHRFAPPRRWRFDYAWPDHLVALEVEGGVWTRGRHTRGSGFLRDMAKYNEATALGWRVLRTTPARLLHPDTIDLVVRTIGLAKRETNQNDRLGRGVHLFP